MRDFIVDNARRVDISGEPHKERGFLQFSKEIRYRIQVDSDRSQIRALDITFRGTPIEELLDKTFHFVCTSFFRGLAKAWEKQALVLFDLFIFNPKDEFCVDTGLLCGILCWQRIEQLKV